MPQYKHQTTRCVESELFPGVSVILKKMTEGRRMELRAVMGVPQKKIRDMRREQAIIEAQKEEIRDYPRWLDLQDEHEQLMTDAINPAWITWGVKQIEGLEVDGKSLGVDDWKDWPSALFDEVLGFVQEEAQLNGSERKNSELPSTSKEPEAQTQSLSIVESAKNADSGEIETAVSITQNT
jgi:hypothetical protein